MTKKSIAVGAIVGAVAGIVAGVLTAPRSGKETRADLKNKANELKSKANAKKDVLVDEVHEKIEDAKDYIDETIKK